MREPVGAAGADAAKSRALLACESVDTILDMFQESDTVSVVAYGLPTVPGVEVLSPTKGMEVATNKVKRQMLDRLAPMNTSTALADPVAGLDAAFDVLETGLAEGGQTAGCNRVILMLGGSPAAQTKCGAACAQDPTAPCTCVADAMALVERRQAALAEKAGRSAVIATTTVGVGADDSLLRQAACHPRSSGTVVPLVVLLQECRFPVLSPPPPPPLLLPVDAAGARRVYRHCDAHLSRRWGLWAHDHPHAGRVGARGAGQGAPRRGRYRPDPHGPAAGGRRLPGRR
eukprot:TRINITY_DN3473_c2_g1_i1.p3 TRINITY_DN3473_c2_g1~~TRINITY_DN3473_c2_g1_i1.p3  ORF type:complete len:294 (+),score=65.79 TRINITY_DN3473_c2_g1_i1:22-882(+)